MRSPVTVKVFISQKGREQTEQKIEALKIREDLFRFVKYFCHLVK